MKRAWAVACGLLFMLFLATCGGGGGGSGSLYTGLTTPAAIDSTNAEEIVLEAYFGGEMSDTSFMPGVLSLQAEGGSAPPAVKISVLVDTLKELTDSIGGRSQAAAAMGQARALTIWGDSDRIFGSVDGYVDYTISWNDQNGEFSGTFSFHDFDDSDGVVFSGTVSVSGITSIYYAPDPLPWDILEISFRFSSFTATDGIDTFRISGTLHLDTGIPTGGPSSATVNLIVRDEFTGKAVWIKDYTVTVFEGIDIGGAFAEMTIAGRIYLHDHGYVDVETIAPFRVYDGDPYPSSGGLAVNGKDGCKARLTVIDDPTYDYQVELDADGDGTYEWLVFGIWT